MKKEKPLILLSNDDGLSAKGLNELVSALTGLGELYVMAPDGPRSGFACAITSTKEVACTLESRTDDVSRFRCTGTPVDSVKIALFRLAPRVPDLVVGGINHGDNSSVNAHYSGTMGVVIEGCLQGIPSIGFSLCDSSADADFTPCLPYVRRISEEVLAKGLPQGICLNVNFPKTPSFEGVRVCRQTRGTWVKEWDELSHNDLTDRYWMAGEFRNDEPEAEDSDRWALRNGYVAITPTQIDFTAYSVMDELNRWKLQP